MKKFYNSPDIEVERFVFEDILTVSGGLGYGNGGSDKEMGEDDEGFTPQA